MYLLQKLVRTLRLHTRRVSWLAVFLGFLAHMLITWGLLIVTGEQELISGAAFPYYYMTTATTIGYGDLSPSTTPGRYVVALWLMPGAVALFAAVLAKSSQSLVAAWSRNMMGLQSYADAVGHTVLIGWRGEESRRLIALLLADRNTDDEGIILVAAEPAENPVPADIRFVRVQAYADHTSYARAAVAGAARIIIASPSDDQSLAAVFAVMVHAPRAHVVVHFECPATAGLALRHYPQIECTRPLHVEMLARAAQDAGSSAVTVELLTVESGPTQYSLIAPPCANGYRFDGLIQVLREPHGALLVGYLRPGAQTPEINPAAGAVVPAGSRLYYYAKERAPSEAVAWEKARA